MSGRTPVARQDDLGGVLLAGPFVHAAAGSDSVTGPRGAAAALLPGVDEVITWRAPRIDPDPAPRDPHGLEAIRTRIAEGRFDTALILTSFHRSPPPTALTAKRNDPRDVANADFFAPVQPTGCGAREPVGRSPEEASWP